MTPTKFVWSNVAKAAIFMAIAIVSMLVLNIDLTMTLKVSGLVFTVAPWVVITYQEWTDEEGRDVIDVIVTALITIATIIAILGCFYRNFLITNLIISVIACWLNIAMVKDNWRQIQLSRTRDTRHLIKSATKVP